MVMVVLMGYGDKADVSLQNRSDASHIRVGVKSAMQILLFFAILGFLVTSSALSSLSMSSANSRILYDVGLSNHGARCRLIMHKKKISDITIASPGDLGGLKSEEYLQKNPQGKMPMLSCSKSGLDIAESDTIARFLLSEYPQGPSFLPDSPLSNLIARIHDMYITPIQACMYKGGPFGVFGTRKDALKELVRQLNVIEGLMMDGKYLCGDEISLADATLFPTAIFVDMMLPKFDITPALPPKLAAWFARLQKEDAECAKVYEEVRGGLQGWEDRNRWDPILGAGLRDTAPATIFDKIVAGEIPSAKVREDDKMLAFKDINPAAPAHVLVIPKDRMGLTNLRKAMAEHKDILGHLMVTAADIANDESLGFGDGARIVVNDGPDGGQEVMHLHIHVLGGRVMTWPPG